MSRFTVSAEDDDKDAAIPAIIAITITPIITPFLFTNQIGKKLVKKTYSKF